MLAKIPILPYAYGKGRSGQKETQRDLVVTVEKRLFQKIELYPVSTDTQALESI